MNQSTFLTDSELFEDILKKSKILITPFCVQVLSSYCCMRFLLVTVTTGKKRLIKIRIQLIRINQLDFSIIQVG
ncbi:hypothetical protein SPAR83_1020 [Streptococcus pneumoniae GA44386]|nr:hypothetical protein SPAR83_1020 [Streptococcus pneumoniae GA44386]